MCRMIGRGPKAATLVAIAVALVGIIVFFVARAKTQGPAQPIEFDHWQHVEKEDGPRLSCDFCHEHAGESAYATIPNVSTCMVCHDSIKTDSPQVQKLAAIAARGQQPGWVRVYWFEDSAKVFFTHKPHVRAMLDCAVCHGKVGEMHRVRREVNQNMGWCIDCHRQRRVSIDCYVCHR
jgi:hypothetical protein